MKKQDGPAPRILRVDLTTGTITRERKDAAWGRKYVGGMGFGTRLLWEELPPETAWDSPDNKLIFSLGALTGTTVCGSGLCCVNTIGPLTNGLASAQTLGHWGTCLRRAGYDILIIQGEAPRGAISSSVRTRWSSARRIGFWARTPGRRRTP